MTPKVLIPTPLRQYVDDRDSVEVEGENIGEALTTLVDRYGDLREHILDGDGELRNFVNVYVEDEDIRYLKGEETPLKDESEVMIVPSVAGGSLGTSAPTKRSQELTNEEIRRYGRHLIMPEVGMEGQKTLKQSSVAVVGNGGLGAPISMYLAAAGVGTLGLVDFDVVEFSNLQRQIIYEEADVDRPKLEAAEERLKGINENVEIEPHETRLTSDNALEILEDYDLVVDGTDNFPTRYLINDACVLLDKPNIYGSIFRFEGQASVFAAEDGPCYRCLYPEPPPPGLVPSCAEGGVLGVLPGTIGSIQATEAIKLLLGEGEPLIGRLLLFDALKMSYRELRVRKDPECPVCGEDPTIDELIDYEEFCGLPQDEETELSKAQITVEQLKENMDGDGDVLVLDVRQPVERNICKIPGSKLIPLDELPDRVNELDTSTPIVAHCHTGVRSARATKFLHELGFTKTKNLKGGIDAWARKIDQSMPRY